MGRRKRTTRCAALLHEIAEMSTTMAASLAAVPLRFPSRPAPLAAADTFIFAAAPNVTSKLPGAGEDLLRRIEGNPQLAPDRLALNDAVRTKESGMTLADSGQLRNALPVDGQGQYSALVCLNPGTLTGALGAAMPGGMDSRAKAGIDELKELLANQSAMAFCVTAERDRVVLTSTGFDLLDPGRILAAMARVQLAAPEGKVRPRVVKGARVVI